MGKSHNFQEAKATEIKTQHFTGRARQERVRKIGIPSVDKYLIWDLQITAWLLPGSLENKNKGKYCLQKLTGLHASKSASEQRPFQL